MLTMPLMGVVFGGLAYFIVYFLFEKKERCCKKFKFRVALGVFVVATHGGLFVACYLGTIVEKKYLKTNEVEIVEEHKLDPFPYNQGVYVVVSKRGTRCKLAVLYFQGGELRKSECDDDFLDNGDFIFSNDGRASRYPSSRTS